MENAMRFEFESLFLTAAWDRFISIQRTNCGRGTITIVLVERGKYNYSGYIFIDKRHCTF